MAAPFNARSIVPAWSVTTKGPFPSSLASIMQRIRNSKVKTTSETGYLIACTSSMKKQIEIIILLCFISCTKTDKIEDLVELKPLPEKVIYANKEKSELQFYADKIESMKINKVDKRLDSSAEKSEFTKHIVNLGANYNRCVELLNEIEKSASNEKNGSTFKSCLVQLDSIMKYILFNYKI